MKKYINRNYFWANLFIEQLAQRGVKHVCISPGSRNTPLTLAFANNKKFKKYVLVDERSNAFFALGLAKALRTPVVIVTTSGTAVAELYPAIIESYIQRIPLIVCTADRPEYLRNCGANQTINQDNIFNNHIRHFIDVGLPEIKKSKLNMLTKKTTKIIEIAINKDPGPVHLNFPFRKPLEPNSFTENIKFNISEFIINEQKSIKKRKDPQSLGLIEKYLNSSLRPLLHCGWGNFTESFNKNILNFSKKNNIPILVDGTSNLRFVKGNNENIIVNHSSFLLHLNEEPDLIIQFGNAPTSQTVLKYFESTAAKRIIINKDGDLKDPSRNKGELFAANPETIFEEIKISKQKSAAWIGWEKIIVKCDNICESEKSIINNSSFGIEPKIVNEVLNLVPNGANIFISNSLPIRDFDYFASKHNKNIKIFTNRGASGIDGIISTASGIALKSNQKSFLVIGDLAFYHNISTLATLKELNIPLKIVLVNNNGGGIFNMLPVSKGNKNYDKYFRTSLNLNYSNIVKSFGVSYYKPRSWTSFRRYFGETVLSKNAAVLEIETDEKESLKLRKKYWLNCKRNLKQ